MPTAKSYLLPCQYLHHAQDQPGDNQGAEPIDIDLWHEFDHIDSCSSSACGGAFDQINSLVIAEAAKCTTDDIGDD